MPKKKIMIVENEFIVAMDIQISLKSLGYDVCAVESMAEKAVSRAGELKPDLVLMDIMLEGDMDGIEAADEIYSCWSIPVVYLSAWADERILERAEKTEPFGYLVKPVNESNLESTVRIALRKAESERRREKEISELKDRLAGRKAPEGKLVVCNECKRALSEKKNWIELEKYLQRFPELEVTYCLCPVCGKEKYSDIIGESNLDKGR